MNNPHLQTIDNSDPILDARMPLVCIQNLSVNRGGQEVLHNLDLEVVEGTFLGLFGPNGGGKTTLLEVLLGQITPSRGYVEVMGRKPKRLNRRRFPIGYVPQYPRLPEAFPATVYDMVLMGAFGASGKFFPVCSQYKLRARQLLIQLRLDHIMDRPPDQISTGQLQRALLARALITHPRLLLLDEPLRGLDKAGHLQFFEFLLDLRREYELTVIMISHDIELLTRFTEPLAYLNGTLQWKKKQELKSRKKIGEGMDSELEAIAEMNKEKRKIKDNPFDQPAD